MRATARDYARFGLLYLRDGVWDGTRVLPAGWVDYGRTWVSVDPEDGSPYGAHWWGVAGDTLGTFRASGYEGQSITICPAARPRRGAPRQDAARARGEPRALARGHGARLRRADPLDAAGPASVPALRPRRGDEDGDLPVRLLLVLGVGRVGRHGPLPPRAPSRRR